MCLNESRHRGGCSLESDGRSNAAHFYYSPSHTNIYVEPNAGVPLKVRIMVVLFTVFSPLIIVRAPVPPTCLHEKIGVTGHSFGNATFIFGFVVMPPPFAIAVNVNLWADPRAAVTAALSPQPVLNVKFALVKGV